MKKYELSLSAKLKLISQDGYVSFVRIYDVFIKVETEGKRKEKFFIHLGDAAFKRF